jgi:chromosome segregation ATPase
MTSDPQLADSIGNWIAIAIATLFALWRRSRQNKTFANDVTVKVDNSIHARVAEIAASLTTTQNLVAIHTEKIKDSNAIANDLKEGMEAHRSEMSAHRAEMGEHRKEMHAFKDTIEKGEVLASQITDYLERAKAGKLKAEPIEGSGGLTAIRSPKKEGT